MVTKLLSIILLVTLSDKPASGGPTTSGGGPCEKQFADYIIELEQMLNKGDYSWLYRRYNTVVQQIRATDPSCGKQLDECQKANTWTKYNSCRISFIQPIIGAMASMRTTTIEGEKELDSWTDMSYINRPDWKNVALDMASLMKKVLTKKVDINLLKREMMYTGLNRLNPEYFSWKEDYPLKAYTQQWYSYAKAADEAALRKLLDQKLDDKSAEFCTNEKNKSSYCSFFAAKSKYDQALLYLPKPSAAIAISATFGEDGFYASFKQALDRFLDKTDIIASVENLGAQLSAYYSTLANFDKEIAQSEVDGITSAIEDNTKRLTTNVQNMVSLVSQIKEDQSDCAELNTFESALAIGISIASTIASGGAIPPNMKEIGEAFQNGNVAETFEKVGTAVQDGIEGLESLKGTVDTLQSCNNKDLDGATGAMKSEANVIIGKLQQNRDKLRNMHSVAKAVLDGISLDTVKAEVQKFLQTNSVYTPAVTKTDLVELDTNMRAMLSTFESYFSNAGTLCKLFVGDDASDKVANAKSIWISINSLLLDIYDQQFQLHAALIKVVRARLDESLAKELAPGINYNFEIIVRHMLAVRVAAQQVCDTFQMMQNDVPHAQCTSIKSTVFLPELTRDRINELDVQLRASLKTYLLIERYAYIPVSSDYSARAVHWGDLISGKVVEFALPSNDATFLKTNGWTDYPTDVALLKSLEVFIPNNILSTGQDQRSSIRFDITAVEDNIVVNGKSTAQRYTIKSPSPISTYATYVINDNTSPCGGTIMNNLFVDDKTTKYCIITGSGRFGNDLLLPLPVSMYSKFRLQLIDGYDDPNTVKVRNFQILSPLG